MRRRPPTLLILLAALAACAEGGIRGSGISTSVSGNVARVQLAGTGDQSLAGIAVSVQNTAIADHTDSDGAFALHGAFDGRVTILFALPHGGGDARLDVNVPNGGTLTLHNVDVDTAVGEAVAESAAVDFTGLITAAHCDTGVLLMQSSPSGPGDADLYIVDLATSTLVNGDGMPVPCSAVQEGDTASVQGLVNDDGSFGEATIVLQN